MRTSLTEIALIEKRLAGELSESDNAAFNERFHRDTMLRLNVRIQHTLLKIVRLYHRKAVRKQLRDIHSEMMNSERGITIKSYFKHN